MNKSNRLLSDIVTNRTYAKYLSHIGRRETFEETINRNMNMFLNKFPNQSRDIVKGYQQVHDGKVMPSMRSMQFGGESILKNNVKLFNCSFAAIDNTRAFAEALYLLMCGTGFGFSVQRHHIGKLPTLRKPKEEGKYIVADSIEGWAEALNALMQAYFNGGLRPVFDYNSIRAKGSRLSNGATAPGHEPLKAMLDVVEAKLKLSIGRKLRPIEVHDTICMIADCVLSGGIRRAACISLFSKDDEEMLTSKQGQWWEKHPYRARSNNSVVLDRATTTKEEFERVFDACIKSNAGEPGFSWSNNIEMGYNPCHEISLNSNQFCNLTSVNLTGVKNEKDLHNRVYTATMLGTMQAAFTDFPYLSESWKLQTEREALLGVSFTGIADSGALTASQLNNAAKLVLEVNEKYAKKLGINLAARTTCVKPEGTMSCVVGSASGIHARYAPHYLRRVRMNKSDALAKYLTAKIPSLVEDDQFSPSGIVVTIPQESPTNAITRNDESANTLLDRVLFYNENWVKHGYRTGDNQHNVSCTINYKPEDVDGLRTRLWDTREIYTGISLLPFDGGSYVQAPFEECTKETFNELSKNIGEINLAEVTEYEDTTKMLETVACGGGSCEWTGA
jgi:ribonucleoside-diphosphate reductase alpha chain